MVGLFMVWWVVYYKLCCGACYLVAHTWIDGDDDDAWTKGKTAATEQTRTRPEISLQ